MTDVTLPRAATPADRDADAATAPGPGFFSGDELALIDETLLVEVETRGADGAVHLTTIWAAVENGQVWVRSHRGSTARWYREALANEQFGLHVDGRVFRVRAVPATDPSSVQACSAGLARVYEGSPDLPSMLVPQILETTLRLDPAES